MSVWETEAALREFVGEVPHVDTMRELGPKLGQERKFVRWKLRGSEVPPTWDQALERLQAGGEAYGSRPAQSRIEEEGPDAKMARPVDNQRSAVIS
jgi:hypothetical protein